MMRLTAMLSVILCAGLIMGACQKPAPEMHFTRVDPDFGGLQGGKTVRVEGRALRLDIGYAVYFGEERSPQVSLQNSQALLVVTPRRASPGHVDVTIRADNGSVFVIKQGFEYINQAGKLLADPETP